VRQQKTYLNPDEIEGIIGAELRTDAACADVKVRVEPVTDPAAESNWSVEVFLDGPQPTPHRNCKLRAIALQQELGRQYAAIWPRNEEGSCDGTN
jgi:hypothetical protein